MAITDSFSYAVLTGQMPLDNEPEIPPCARFGETGAPEHPFQCSRVALRLGFRERHHSEHSYCFQ
jgi:hypothetical protein